MATHYQILGVEMDADAGQIKEAYRKKAKEYHPDKGGDTEMFKHIAEAYKVLSDPEKKRNYDRVRKSPAGGRSARRLNAEKRYEEMWARADKQFEAYMEREQALRDAAAEEEARNRARDAERNLRNKQEIEELKLRNEKFLRSRMPMARGAAPQPAAARSASAPVEASVWESLGPVGQPVSAYDYTKVGPSAEHLGEWRAPRPLEKAIAAGPSKPASKSGKGDTPAVAQSSAEGKDTKGDSGFESELFGGDKKRKSKKFKSKKFKSKKKKSKRKSKRSSKKRKTRGR